MGKGTIVSLFTTSLLLSYGCSGDSNVSFDPVAGSSSGGSSEPTAGTKPTGSSGSQQNGGSSAAGSNARAGSDAGGSDAGGTDTGGSDAGGTDAGGATSAGTDAGGTDTGGTSNAGTDAGGSATAGMAGTTSGAGMGGTGTAGSGGTDSAGMGGTGTAGTGTAGTGTAGTGGSGGGSTCTPKPEVCDGIDNNCDKVVDPAGTCPDSCTGALFGGHTYYFCGGAAVAAATAYTKCDGFKMVMASVETQVENDFITSRQKGSSWLGGSDVVKEGEWRWASSGAIFSDNNKPIDSAYSNWLAGQPNDNAMPPATHENCLVVLAGGGPAQVGKWNDVACDLTARVVCESTGPAVSPGP